jgi:hypothetical protein
VIEISEKEKQKVIQLDPKKPDRQTDMRDLFVFLVLFFKKIKFQIYFFDFLNSFH